jgi:hypothetical protein
MEILKPTAHSSEEWAVACLLDTVIAFAMGTCCPCGTQLERSADYRALHGRSEVRTYQGATFTGHPHTVTHLNPWGTVR